MRFSFPSLIGFAVLVLAGWTIPGRGDARQIFLCTSSTASPALQKAVTDFSAQAGQVPVLKALQDSQDATELVAKTSEDLMLPAAFKTAAHNHLLVIGLLSQDTLAQKIMGHFASIDETKKEIYAQGWGHLQGDVGYIESDRNPFLHSGRIESSPEGTDSMLITGTSEAGVLAALHAFEGGMLNGLVPAGPVKRLETTLLDQDPVVGPAPFPLPPTVTLESGTATLAGWTQVPRDEYLNVLENGKTEPKHMWRYKYLATKFLEDKSMQRWLENIQRRGLGNAVDVIEFDSPDVAHEVAHQLTLEKFTDTPGLDGGKQTPLWTDEDIERSYWNIVVYPAGRFVLVSTLPPAAIGQVADGIKVAP